MRGKQRVSSRSRGSLEILFALSFLVIGGIMAYMSIFRSQRQIAQRTEPIRVQEGFYAGEMVIISYLMHKLEDGDSGGKVFVNPESTPSNNPQP